MDRPFQLALGVHAACALRQLLAPSATVQQDPADESSKHQLGAVPVTDRLRPVIGVSIGWLLLFFSFLARQSGTAFNVLAQLRGQSGSMNSIKYGSGGGSLMLNADRTVGNMCEQSVPFLLSLWMHALFVDSRAAAKLGWAWLCFRAVYPAVFGKIPWMFCSTFPGYGIIAALAWPVAKLSYNNDM